MNDNVVVVFVVVVVVVVTHTKYITFFRPFFTQRRVTKFKLKS